MTVRDLAPGDRLEQHGSTVVVLVAPSGVLEHFVRCISAIVRSTTAEVPLLIAADELTDPALRRWLDELAGASGSRAFAWMRSRGGSAYADRCNAAFAATTPADVVLLDDDQIVAEGWLDGLRAAAESESIAATAVPLAAYGTWLSVDDPGISQPRVGSDVALDTAAERLRHRSPRVRPRVPLVAGGCVWIKRAALDVVGGLDNAIAEPGACRVDFGQRCLAYGLQTIVADDVVVASATTANEDDIERDPVLASRRTYLRDLTARVDQDRHSSVRRALLSARAALRRPSVTIDGRALTQSLAGTQVHTLELIAALSRTEEVDLRVVVPPDLGDYARDVLAELRDINVTPYDDVPYPTALVHRPYQVSHPRDLRLLLDWGDRVLITNQDLISYRTPDHFPTFDQWTRFRILTAESMAVASLVLFFSHHAAQDVLSEDILPAERARVVPIGVDHRLPALAPTPSAPKDRSDLADAPFLLVLGNRYRHKNRVFALRLLKALRDRHGWHGRLVFAGAEVANGSSSGEEAGWLATNPDVAPFVVDVAAIEEGEKAWLYEHATAVVYPTLYEGFGLIPFEAAAYGKPCLWAPQAALAEVLPADAALLVAWDADRSADRAIRVLKSREEASTLVELVRDHAAAMTWDRTAQQTLDVYREALAIPAREMLRLRELTITAEAAYWGLREAIGPSGLALVDPKAALLPEDAQRALAALARRPVTRRPLLSTLRFLGNLGRRGGDDLPPQRTWRDGPEPPGDDA